MRNPLALGFLLLLVLAGAVGIFATQHKTIYKTYVSPDGRFKLVAYCYDLELGIAFPGDGGDSNKKGLICLYEHIHGKELNRRNVEALRWVQDIEWSSTNVSIPAVLNWTLPTTSSGN